MAIKNYDFKYGKGQVSIPLEEERVLGVLAGRSVGHIEDICSALYNSLDEPIDAPPLKEYLVGAESVALVVSDMSRFWMRQDLVIPHLVSYIEGAGIPAGHIDIVVANGTHECGSEEDLRTIVTDAVYERIRVRNHNCLANDLVYLGTTSFGTRVSIDPVAAKADRVICLGAVSHHIMAGFGGGRKSILPGISSLEAVKNNHGYSLHPTEPRSNPLIGNAVLEGNPLHLDMCEAAGMIGRLYMVNLVMNADMRLSAIYSGHWLHSWERACREVCSIYNVSIPERADVVITGCGGYPKDMSLYQGTKTLDNVESGCKEGGTLIAVMEAREGGGPAEYFDWIDALKRGTIYDELRADFTIPGYVFSLNCEQAAKYRVMLLTSVDPAVVAPMGIEAFNDVESLLAAAKLEGKSIYVIPNGSTVIPILQ